MITVRIEDILTPECTSIDANISSKKKLLEYLASTFAKLTSTSAGDIFTSLLNRERLGSTALGLGVAIPHSRLPCSQPLGILLKLEQAIDFDTHDGQPVDVIFALIVPPKAEEQHVQALAMLARNFSNPHFIEALRKAPNSEQLYQRAINLQQP